MDYEFIAGDFLENMEIPRDQKYLLKYFHTPFQEQFLRYYLVFHSTKHFVAHTGIISGRRNLELMVRRFKSLEAMHSEAKRNMDFEMLEQIETGQIDTNQWR